MKTRILALVSGLALVAGLGIWAAVAPPPEQVIGTYITSLHGRTAEQIFNCRISMRKINGLVIPPGHTFSFLRAVGPWTADMGYKKAPVSYDGELVKSWGGGVCQVSTTVYNAALLAGLDVTERHHHHWPARYAPLGRDAAVAYENIDLKFRNNLSSPVRIVGKIKGNDLVFSILSSSKPKYKVKIESELRSATLPNEVIQATGNGEGRRKVVNRGHPGFYVATYRRFIIPSGDRREFLSADRYPAMSRVVRISAR
ncbi:MAG TPA: VanW family protein [Armatimonadota bacterium]|jgi:vancomycin resistance protein YoaR